MQARDTGGVGLVFVYLREQILSESLIAGDRLPPERDLALHLGISRPVLREALRALAMIGVVEIRHGAGTILRRPGVATALGDFFAFAMLQDVPVAEDVMEARMAVECQAGRLACARAMVTDFEALRTALERIHAPVGEVEAGARATSPSIRPWSPPGMLRCCRRSMRHWPSRFIALTSTAAGPPPRPTITAASCSP